MRKGFLVMKNKKLMILILAAAVVVIGIILLMQGGKKSYSAQPASLQLNLTPGQSVKLRRTQRVDLEVKGFMGPTMDYKLELDYTITCKEVKPDGTMFLEQRWDAGRLEGSGRKGPLEWDSSKGPRVIPPQAKLYSKLVGNSIELEVTPKGEVVEIWGLEVIADALLYQAGIRVSNEITEEQYKNYQEMKMDEVWETKEHILDPSFREYPEKTFQPVDTWLTNDTGIITGTVGTALNLTYKGMHNQHACFEVATTVTGGGTPEKERTFDVERQVKGDGKGEVEVDVETGLIVGAEVTFDWIIHATNEFLWQPELRSKEKIEGQTVTIIKRL